MQPYNFFDDLAFETASHDEEALAKAEKLYMERERKSRYVVYDLETFPLDQESGCERPVIHVLVAATVCYNCLNKKYLRQLCSLCGGLHNTDSTLTTVPWELETTTFKISSWVAPNETSCEDCNQQQIVIRSDDETSLFKPFIDWLLRDSMRGYTPLAHNGSGFHHPYLAAQVRVNYGVHEEPIYNCSRLLELKVKRTKDV
jgi:hypothetical protein